MRSKRLTGDLLTIYQTAHLLGVSVSTVYAWSERGEMPAPVRFGGRLRWRRSVIEAWAAADFPRSDPQPKRSKADT